MNLEAAISFVRQHGDAIEQARLRYLLDGSAPAPAIVARLLVDQREDGGWAPFWTAGYSSLDATCFRLAQADQLGLGPENPAIEPALDLLARRQRADGSWAETPPADATPPPWARPDDPAATLYLTTNCGFWLARAAGFHDPTDRAAELLQSQLGPDGRLPSFLHTHWLAVGLWHAVGRHDCAEQSLGYLGRRLDELSASNITWMLSSFATSGVPREHELIARALRRLSRLQRDDGSWPSEDGTAYDIHTALEALRAGQFFARE